MVICERMTPAMALATDVPMDRIRVLRLFAAAVSLAGTAPMIRAGIEPYVKPMPAPITQETITRCHTSDISTMFRPYPQATITAPIISVTFGPLALDTAAETGAVAIITRPEGAITRPAVSSDLPRP